MRVVQPLCSHQPEGTVKGTLRKCTGHFCMPQNYPSGWFAWFRESENSGAPFTWESRNSRMFVHKVINVDDKRTQGRQQKVKTRFGAVFANEFVSHEEHSAKWAQMISMTLLSTIKQKKVPFQEISTQKCSWRRESNSHEWVVELRIWSRLLIPFVIQIFVFFVLT